MMGFLNTSLENGVCTLLKCTMSKERSSGEDGISKFRQAIVQGTNPDFFFFFFVPKCKLKPQRCFGKLQCLLMVMLKTILLYKNGVCKIPITKI